MLNFRYERPNSRTNFIFDHYLTITQILPNPQIRISIPVYIAFFTVISDIRKPPKEPSFEVLVRPTGFEPAAYRVGVIRPSRRKPRFYAGFRYIAQN